MEKKIVIILSIILMLATFTNLGKGSAPILDNDNKVIFTVKMQREV